MDWENPHSVWNVAKALGSMLFGVVVLVMFVLALKRKGWSAILLLPFGLWLFVWNPWEVWRYQWFGNNIPTNNWTWFGVLLFERAIALTAFLLALLLIFKKDKPKPEEPPKPS